MAVNVLLVEDELVDSSISVILRLEDGIKMVGFCKKQMLVFKMVDTCKDIDVLLMHIQRNVYEGLAAVKRIKEMCPRIKILILTACYNDEYLFEAIKSGARGYIPRNVTSDQIIDAINIVSRGNMLVHGDMASRLPKLMSERNNYSKECLVGHYITKKEIEIVELISRGLNNGEIGKKLFLCEGTIKNKVSEILSKLGLRDRTQLAVFYLNRGCGEM